jgi:SMC interacting uncharacterized protein involved in chromosome segregation
MVPDSPESQIAVLLSRVDSLEAQVRAFAISATRVERLDVQQENMAEDIRNIAKDVHQIKQLHDQREERIAQDRRAMRVALYGLIGLLLATLISGAVTIVVAFA